MKKLVLMILVPFALLAGNFGVKSISNVVKDTPPTFTKINSKDATLEFISSIPLNCSIVYGTTKKYGNLAINPGMNGPMAVNHRPILTNLKPSTIYHARVQGVDAEGNIYVGKDIVFKTKDIVKGALKNIALVSNGAKVKSVSSNWGNGSNGGSYGANSAIDGNPTTSWSSNSDGDNAFIEVQFPKKSQIHYIKVWTRTMSNNTAQIFSFNVVNDKGETFGPFKLPDASRAYKFNLKTKTKTLKLQALKTNTGNTGLVEFKVY